MLKNKDIIENRYKIQRKIGEGGFGKVYLVEDLHDFNRNKIMKECTTQGSKARELFKREAKILSSLQSPQIPNFEAYFEDKVQGIFYIIQSYIPGKTYLEILEERISKKQYFTQKEVYLFLLDILPVIEYIHSCGVIHRDISLDNIILSTEVNKPVLIDFGIGKYSQSRNVIPRPKTIAGKAEYAPPEQFKGQHIDETSDLYALAIAAIFLLSGELINSEKNLQSFLLEYLKELKLHLSMQQILLKMLEVKRSMRFASATEVRVALESINIIDEELSKESIKLMQLQSSTSVLKDFFCIPTNLLNKKNIKKSTLLISCFLIAIISIFFLKQRMDISLCYVIRSCYLEKHEKIFIEAQSVLNEVKSSWIHMETLDKKEEKYLELIFVFQELQKIPKHSSFYSDSIQLTKVNSTFLENLKIDLDKEKYYYQSYIDIHSEIEENIDLMKNIKNIDESESIYNNLDALKKELSMFPKGFFIDDQVVNSINHITSLLSQLDELKNVGKQDIQKIENAKFLISEFMNQSQNTEDISFLTQILVKLKETRDDLKQISIKSLYFSETSLEINRINEMEIKIEEKINRLNSLPDCETAVFGDCID